MRTWLGGIILLLVGSIWGWTAAAQSGGGGAAPAPGEGIRAANPNLIPEAREVLAFLKSIQGKKTLTGISSSGGWRSFYEWTGRMPAIYGEDCNNMRRPKFGPEYSAALQKSIDMTRAWWEEKGGIPSLHFHWGKPGDPQAMAWVKDRPYNKGCGPMDMAALVKPGTAEHAAALEDLKRVADYLEQLNQAHVPVLWRPFHEIDGGWFWWTDKTVPENSAAAYRMMFDYFVKERKLDNLIWVYAAANRAGGFQYGKGGKDAAGQLADEIAFRKRYYPGDGYVDIVGIDMYPDAALGYDVPANDSYPKAYQIMAGVAPGKVYALCESAGLVNPDKLGKDTPEWLYDMAWFAGNERNPPEWLRSCCQHERYLTLDQLPALGKHAVAPDVRMVEPADGAEVGTAVELRAEAGDRNGTLKSVTFYLLQGPWKDWTAIDALDCSETLAKATKLGEGKANAAGPYAMTWNEIKPGLYDVAAVATDAEGQKTLSSVVRVAAGVKNLARKKAASSSAGAESKPEQACDGDLVTPWNTKKAGEQWLAVDLGQEETIGAATLSWWRYYAQSYVLQVSDDGAQWREVFRQGKKTGKSGDTDVIRFAPVQARHVRLVCPDSPNNKGYSLFEFRVFGALP